MKKDLPVLPGSNLPDKPICTRNRKLQRKDAVQDLGKDGPQAQRRIF